MLTLISRGAVVAVSVLMCAQSAVAQTKYKPCSLFSEAEATALTGEPVTKTNENEIPFKKGPTNDHDDVLSMCTRSLPANRMVQLTVSSTPVTPEGRAAGEAKTKSSVEALEKQGAKVESKDYGAIKCSTIVMQGELAPVSGTNCGGVKGGLFFSISASAGPKGPVPMDQVHALAATIVSRLP